MCYSARIWADYRKYVRAYGADIDIKEFVELFWWRWQGRKVKIPKGVEGVFAQPATEQERQIRTLIDEFNAAEAAQFEEEIRTQQARLAKAEQALLTKVTKKAAEDRRIATDKIAKAQRRLGDLQRTEPRSDDDRIYPGVYAPVMVMEKGKRVVRPMRYQCRPAGMPPSFDREFPGTYNARRDSLGKFWKKLFGFTHGVIVFSSFFEYVDRNGIKTELEFDPQPAQDMLVACLWSRWTAPGEPDLLSFAVITDDPPEEVMAAGHDRCVVPIKPANIDAWLNPDPADLATQYAILDDRARPYYAHKVVE